MPKSKLRARDIMKSDVLTVRPDTPLRDLERLLLRERIGGAPVVDRDGTLVGIVGRSDIVRALGVETSIAEVFADYQRDLSVWGAPDAEAESEWISETAAEQISEMRVGDAMTHTVMTVGPDFTLDEIARVLCEHHIHRVLVTENGRLEGIVTMTDIVRLFADGRATAL